MPLTDADALDPLVVAPVIHEPLTWPAEAPRRRGGYDAERLRRSYPYRFFVERPHEEGLLRLWLQGAPVDGYAVMHDKDALDVSALGRWLDGSIDKPLPGGASLVTGLRGVGKTTLVRKVLFDVAVAARHGIRLDPRMHICDALARAPTRPRTEEQWLYVPVRVDVASPISGDQLLRRIIRRTYLALAAHGVGDLHPEMMRQARTSYLRTLGELSESASDSLSEALGLKTDLLAKLEVTAEQELAFARSLELVAKQLSVEEAEDELVDLGRTLAGPPLGQSPSVLRAAWSSTGEASAQVWARLRDSLSGKAGVRVLLVYLLDELDKMPSHDASGGELLGSALAVVRRLKTLMTVEGVMAVAIGGHVVEQHWNDDRFRLDADLRSIFSRHVYVPKLRRAEVASFLARRRPTLRGADGAVADDMVDAACFVTRGRYKDLLRWAARHSDPLDSGLPPALGRIIGEWGGASIERGQELMRQGHADVAARLQADGGGSAGRAVSEIEAFTAAMAAAGNVEDLVSVVIATTYRGASTTRFAADVARAVLLAQVELCLDGHQDDVGAEIVLPSGGAGRGRQAHLEAQAAGVIPRRFVDPLLARVRGLVAERFPALDQGL